MHFKKTQCLKHFCILLASWSNFNQKLSTTMVLALCFGLAWFGLHLVLVSVQILNAAARTGKYIKQQTEHATLINGLSYCIHMLL